MKGCAAGQATFAHDVLACPRCAGRLQIIAFITDLAVVTTILSHLHLPTALPEPLPARLPPQLHLELTDDDHDLGEPDECSPSRAVLRHPRGPP